VSDAIIEQIESSRTRSDLPTISVGDTVDVHVRIIEGAKQRIQVFSGVIIKKQGRGLTATITVRRIVANEGVERTFPIHSPKVAEIRIKRRADTRRAKLYYLRDRVGKSRRLRDRRRGLAELVLEKEKGAAGAGDVEQSAEAAHSPDEAKAVAAETEPVQEETGKKA
jgi:large subunit ribosomal protein L19